MMMNRIPFNLATVPARAASLGGGLVLSLVAGCAAERVEDRWPKARGEEAVVELKREAARANWSFDDTEGWPLFEPNGRGEPIGDVTVVFGLENAPPLREVKIFRTSIEATRPAVYVAYMSPAILPTADQGLLKSLPNGQFAATFDTVYPDSFPDIKERVWNLDQRFLKEKLIEESQVQIQPFPIGWGVCDIMIGSEVIWTSEPVTLSGGTGQRFDVPFSMPEDIEGLIEKAYSSDPAKNAVATRWRFKFLSSGAPQLDERRDILFSAASIDQASRSVLANAGGLGAAVFKEDDRQRISRILTTSFVDEVMSKTGNLAVLQMTDVLQMLFEQFSIPEDRLSEQLSDPERARYFNSYLVPRIREYAESRGWNVVESEGKISSVTTGGGGGVGIGFSLLPGFRFGFSGSREEAKQLVEHLRRMEGTSLEFTERGSSFELTRVNTQRLIDENAVNGLTARRRIYVAGRDGATVRFFVDAPTPAYIDSTMVFESTPRQVRLVQDYNRRLMEWKANCKEADRKYEEDLNRHKQDLKTQLLAGPFVMKRGHDKPRFGLPGVMKGTKLFFDVWPTDAVVRWKEEKNNSPDIDIIKDRQLHGFVYRLPWDARGTYYFKQDSHPEATITVWNGRKPTPPVKRPYPPEPQPVRP